ncbi:helix-turn-helix transcriptional regulator [Streptomyces klenkii]|uniref:helix-turn-helix transcriptional regulator n=1 Tax=Streptomyces klenkii TaxID=1420899 RepID=UPI0036E2176B
MHQPPPTFEVNGTAIREIRMRAGVAMSELARRAGISRRYLNHLELGSRHRMRPGPYLALRNALNATDEELLAESSREEVKWTTGRSTTCPSSPPTPTRST